MKRGHAIARFFGCLVGLASTVTAWALPPSRGPRPPAASPSLVTPQPLVGWHAPSSDPPPRDARGRPMLALRTLNHGESLALSAATDDGGFAAVDLDRVAHLLRAPSGDEHPIDPRTLGVVYRLQTHFGAPEVRVVSGYRTPRPGSRSNHGKGRAVDLVIPGVPDEDVAQFAREIGFVGVGVYPESHFVHVDIRPRSYFWVDSSGPHTKNRERSVLGELARRSDAAAAERGQQPIEPFSIATDVDEALRRRGIADVPTDDDVDDEN